MFYKDLINAFSNFCFKNIYFFLANSTEVNNLFNSAASQLAAAGYPYIYEGIIYKYTYIIKIQYYIIFQKLSRKKPQDIYIINMK